MQQPCAALRQAELGMAAFSHCLSVLFYQCGPCTYFCGSCLEKQHTNSNIFHLPLQWKVSVLMQGLHHVLLFYRMVDMFR